MRSGKEKGVTPPPRNSETSCSNGNISETTGRILFKMTPVDSPPREFSSGTIYTKIRPVVWEILPFEHDVSIWMVEFTLCSIPLLIYLQRDEQQQKTLNKMCVSGCVKI